MSFSVVYITHASREEADRVSQQVVNERLAACANVFPINSMYWWQESIEQEGEWVSLLKTTHVMWPVLKTRIEAIHAYDTPCIMRWQVEANTKYEAWIESEVKSL